MTANAAISGKSVIAAVRYRDIAAAADWLCKAFGFERHLVVTGGNGEISHAELKFGKGTIVIDPLQKRQVSEAAAEPGGTGGLETQRLSLVVVDADAHYAHAKEAGADIVIGVRNEVGGGRGYACRDPEGHIWNFGTRAPGQGQSAREEKPRRLEPGVFGGQWRSAVVAGLAGLAAVSAVTASLTYRASQQTLRDLDASRDEHAEAESEKTAALVLAANEWRAADAARRQLLREQTAIAAVEQAAETARRRLSEEQIAKRAAEHSVEAARRQLAEEQAAKRAVERVSEAARQHLEQEHAAKLAMESAVEVAHRQLEQERTAKLEMEHAAEAAQLRLAQEQAARLTAERAVEAARQQLEREQAAKLAAEQEVRAASDQLEQNRVSRLAAERVAAEARRKLMQWRKARLAAERAAAEARQQLKLERKARLAAQNAAAGRKAAANTVRQQSNSAASAAASGKFPNGHRVKRPQQRAALAIVWRARSKSLAARRQVEDAPADLLWPLENGPF